MNNKIYWVTLQIKKDIEIPADNETDAKFIVKDTLDEELFQKEFQYYDLEVKKVKVNKNYRDYTYDFKSKKVKQLFEVEVIIEKEITIEAENEEDAKDIAIYETKDDLYSKGVIFSKVIVIDAHLNEFYYEED